jgi:hypothetical protein
VRPRFRRNDDVGADVRVDVEYLEVVDQVGEGRLAIEEATRGRPWIEDKGLAVVAEEHGLALRRWRRRPD